MIVTTSEESKADELDPTADKEEEQITEQVGHAPVFTMSDQLVATGSVPRILEEVSKPQQRAQAEELYTFLHSPTPILARLNEQQVLCGISEYPKDKVHESGVWLWHRN